MHTFEEVSIVTSLEYYKAAFSIDFYQWSLVFDTGESHTYEIQ